MRQAGPKCDGCASAKYYADMTDGDIIMRRSSTSDLFTAG
jgi:hypothetical protein